MRGRSASRVAIATITPSPPAARQVDAKPVRGRASPALPLTYKRIARSAVEQFAEHVWQDAAVAHVLDFLGRVDPRQHLELARAAAVADAHLELLAPRDAR